MKCSVEVNGMKLRAFHGVLPEERITGNIFIVDLRVDYPFEKAMETDNLNYTVNYARLTEIIRHEMRVPSALLEHVARRIIFSVIKEYPASTSGKIRIAKTVPPLPSIVDSCSVTVEW